MSQSLSIRFQAPEDLTGPTKDLLNRLMNSGDRVPNPVEEEAVLPVELPPSEAQEQLNLQALRHKLRRLEAHRALKTTDGMATWILTDSICFDPKLAERVQGEIVGAGLDRGRIIYGPHEFYLPSGHYMAIIEFQVTNLPDARRVATAGEVILNNQTYLSRQKKTISARGSYTFRLPFTVRESDLLAHPAPAIEVRLNLKGILGIRVTQVAVVYKAAGLADFFTHPVAHIRSGGDACVRWLGRRISKARR